MSELLEIFLFPRRIGNALHGFCVAFLWLLLSLLALDVAVYGGLWLSGHLDAFLRINPHGATG